MPVHKTKSGGYQWGKTGKVYYGKDAKKKAQKQGIAIRLSGWKEKDKKQVDFMKRQIYANPKYSQSPGNLTVDDIPNISDRYLDVNVILSWLDRLEEVQKHEENIGNN